MISITISDVGSLSKAETLALAEFFSACKPTPADVVSKVLREIAAEDRPDAGAPVSAHVVDTDNSKPPLTAMPLEQALDAAKLGFGAATPASVPVVPPVPPVPTAGPSVPEAPAVPASTPASVPPVPPVGALQAGADVPAAPPAPTNALDIHGLPWDERIHSGKRGKNDDGSWRKKRGTDQAVVAQVEAQLRALMSTPAPGIPAPPVPPAPTPAAQVPAVPQPPVPPAAPVAPVADVITFESLMEKLTKWVGNQKITVQQANTVASTVTQGACNAIYMLQARPDLLPAALAELRKLAGE